MKDRTVMRADLRTDLKDSGALWSDPELNRCIERAHADLSRFLPRALMYEEVLSFDVSGESVTFPKDTDPDYCVDAVTFNGKTAGDVFTITASPDVPRVVTLLVTDADNSITDWHIRVHGVDGNDLGVTEDFYYGNGKSQTGKQIFKTIHKVELVEDFGGTAAAGDVLDIGIGAYTDTWVALAYKPVKYHSDSGTDDASAALTRNTDYNIDYGRGMAKAISGGIIAAEEVCSFTYKKNQTHIDLNALDDFIRVHRCEYPVGEVPQQFVPTELFGRWLSITGEGESDPQPQLAEGRQVRIYYDGTHHPPTDYTPGTCPEFLETTVELAAQAYALFIYSLKCTHQALTDLDTARTAIAAADAAQAAIGTALTSLKKYLDNNSSDDAESVLGSIDLSAIVTALDAANAYLDSVATDLTNSDNVRDNYMNTTNYVDGGTEPDIKTYLETGDGLLNSITEGGEDERTPEVYATFAQITKNALVAAHEQDRAFYQQDATARTNAALGFVQEAAQRASRARILIDQAAGYQGISTLFAREAEDRIAQIEEYLREAAQSINSAGGDLTMADRFRTEATERRNEVYNIWRDRKEYIGDFAASSMNQVPTNSRS